MTIIDGKEVAAKLRKEIAAEVEAWVASGHRAPHLVAILVGNDGASQTYVGHKEKCCAEVGLPVRRCCASTKRSAKSTCSEKSPN